MTNCGIGRKPNNGAFINCGGTWSSVSSSSAASSSVELSSGGGSSGGASSDSGGGSESGGSSDSGEGGEGTGGGGQPCGYGDYPPCEVYPTWDPLCYTYPELCYSIESIPGSIDSLKSAVSGLGGKVDGVNSNITAQGNRIVEGLDGIKDAIEGLDLGDSSGNCLDSANCEPASWSGDSIPYVAGDDTTGGAVADTSGASWVRSILSAATIPQAARTCPKIPTADFDLLGRPYKLEYNICQEQFNIGGRHVLQLIGEILRAVCGLLAVFIVLGAVSSFNAGLHRMRVLGK